MRSIITVKFLRLKRPSSIRIFCLLLRTTVNLKYRTYLLKLHTNYNPNRKLYEVYNDKDINRHIAVRDFLRTHSDRSSEYGELKMKLSARFPEDIAGYCTAKDSFVKKLEKDALLCYRVCMDRDDSNLEI
ncbi:MAG: GrpB family protein [Eubacteriales bacterium]|nr:GrpB family protein [Eubacteriales bacterium]